LVKTLSTSWRSNNDVIDVVPSLEVSFLETHSVSVLQIHFLRRPWSGRHFCRMTGRKGVGYLTTVAAASCWWSWVVALLPFDCSLRVTTAGVVVQWPMQCGTASKDDTCSNDNKERLGLHQIVVGGFSMAGPSRWGTTSEDSASDIHDLLVRRRWHHARVSNKMKLTFGGDSGDLLRIAGVGHLCSLS
jgi:hypothetical protein